MSKTVRELAEKIEGFISERDWHQFHTPKNLAMSAAIEAAELMELYQWTETADVERVKEEAADVLAYLLSLSNRLGFDLGDALLAKMDRNALKYPADQFRGIAGRPK